MGIIRLTARANHWGCISVEMSGENPNHVSIASNLGHTDIFVNGKKVCYIGINPIGNGGDWLAFPVLAEMGVDISGNAVISNLKVRNFREPSNVLFADSAAHAVTGRINLPERSMPQLRTNIPVDGKRDVKSARIDVTARGIYDLKVNGKRVTEGYFYPGSTQYNKTHLFNTFDITPYLTEANNTLDVSMGRDGGAVLPLLWGRCGISMATGNPCLLV